MLRRECVHLTDAEPRRIQAKYDQTTGRLTRLEFDSNNNGKPDTWAFMDGTRIDKLEADENEDGKSIVGVLPGDAASGEGQAGA